MNPLCIYHGNCADGFAAACVVREAFDEIDFHAGVYQDPPPDVTGRDVILVDFSYKRPVLEEMARSARTITILDHHKSAAEDLEIYDESPTVLIMPEEDFATYCASMEIPPIRALFDMERSGAMLAWDFYFPDEEPPDLLKHIQDRDLWRFHLSGTREIQAALFSYPYDFDTWHSLIWGGPEVIEQLYVEGCAIERKHHKDVAELVAVCKRRMTIAGHDVPVASLPYTLSSDAGHLMAQGEPFAACYWDTEAGRGFSLRSTDDGLDVSEIAKQYGGGGHRNAAGFRVDRDHELWSA